MKLYFLLSAGKSNTPLQAIRTPRVAIAISPVTATTICSDPVPHIASKPMVVYFGNKDFLILIVNTECS